MRAAAIREIIEGIDGLDVDEAAKDKLRELVCAVGRDHGYKAIDRAERVGFARRLLEARISRPTIRDRLIAFYDISPKHAYRIIHAALQLCQKLTPNVTQKNENSNNG